AVVFSLEGPLGEAGRVLAGWQQLAPWWPDELTVVLEIYGTAAGRVTCDGLFLGDQAELFALLAPLLAAGSTRQISAQSMPYLEAAQHYSGESTEPYFKAKSDYALAPLSAEAIATVVQFMGMAPRPENSIQFQPYGGAIDRVPVAATAFSHRAGTLFSMQYLAHWSSEAEGPASLGWIGDFYAAMHPYVSGYAYSNNCDADLADWPRAYYGTNLERLVEVKTRYDPRN